MELQVALIGFQGPEELAPILLRLARSHMQGGAFLPEQVTQQAMREGLVVNHRDFDRLEPLASKRLAFVLSQAAVPYERLRDRAA